MSLLMRSLLVLVALTACQPVTAPALPWQPIMVTLEPLALDRDRNPEPGTARIRDLRGFRLTSDDPRFGGLSGAVWQDGHLYAVSDRGTIFRATPKFDDQGLLTNLYDWRAASLEAPDIRRAALDVEALAGDRPERLTIGLEDRQTLRHLDLRRDNAMMSRDGPATSFPDLSGNEGIEGLCSAPGGGWIAFSEAKPERDGYAVSWVDGRDAHTLSYRAAPDFKVTGADRVGDRIFVLERRFGFLSGWQSRISMVNASDLTSPDARLIPQRLVHLRPPMHMDNFEAIATRKQANGLVTATLLSDDNFNPLQETLLYDITIDVVTPDETG